MKIRTYQLGEKYSEEKLVHKALRSLPTRFCPKVVAIEAKDVTKLALDDLLGSL